MNQLMHVCFWEVSLCAYGLSTDTDDNISVTICCGDSIDMSSDCHNNDIVTNCLTLNTLLSCCSGDIHVVVTGPLMVTGPLWGQGPCGDRAPCGNRTLVVTGPLW